MSKTGSGIQATKTGSKSREYPLSLHLRVVNYSKSNKKLMSLQDVAVHFEIPYNMVKNVWRDREKLWKPRQQKKFRIACFPELEEHLLQLMCLERSLRIPSTGTVII